MQNLAKYILFILFIIANTSSYAVREITITEGQADPTPIAVNFFDNNGGKAQEISKNIIDVISQDLNSSAFFRIIPSGAFIENKIGLKYRPSFASWRQIKAQLLINGYVSLKGDKLEVAFIIWDNSLEKDIHREILELNSKFWRRAAHKIADTIYERITGDKGYFDTRVAYISESGPPKKKIKKLSIMDFDGANHKYLTNGRNLVLTPRFSPDASKILYMVYVKNKPRVYLKDIKTGAEKILGDFPGMSFAPRFSPDGRKALMSVAKNGATNILEIDLATKRVKKLTNDYAINTSPSYSPDGGKIVFNSNRNGTRQLYVMNSDGSNLQRISFGAGSYATPVWSPKGDYIAFTKLGGGFYIGVMKPDGSGERIITGGYLVEGPTWSPSGRLIMFTRESKLRNNKVSSRIYYIDISGRNERLVRTNGDASDPEWSKLLD